MSGPGPDDILAELRVEIDRIDANVHELLMARGRIIDRLIAVKQQQGGGSAFRPGREAAMMRALAERHEGLLPLDTVEGIWRIIISTFTFVQAPYKVHADASKGDAAARDTARFHFGFTVPLINHEGPPQVIAAVTKSTGDLGIVRIDPGPAYGAWWMALIEPDAPKIIARLPFVERPDHPAGMPVFVISHPLAEAASRDITIRAASISRWRNAATRSLQELNSEIIANAADGMGLSLLIASPGDIAADAIAQALTNAGVGDVRLHEIGSHARRYDATSRPHHRVAAE